MRMKVPLTIYSNFPWCGRWWFRISSPNYVQKGCEIHDTHACNYCSSILPHSFYNSNNNNRTDKEKIPWILELKKPLITFNGFSLKLNRLLGKWEATSTNSNLPHSRIQTRVRRYVLRVAFTIIKCILRIRPTQTIPPFDCNGQFILDSSLSSSSPPSS